MRVAFFSPMPPAASGIADYSAALVEPLARIVGLDVFDRRREFQPDEFDLMVYQHGNNPDHDFVYEAALEHPGIAVVHEPNLHHLIAALTIRRNDWDAYLREVEYDSGATALEYARSVRALETGPDYEGVPILRRLLERSRAAIVHSRYAEAALRRSGFQGPVAVIPHGAWVADADRNSFRHRLALSESVPLVGCFGYLKPYKRIAESLRAFRRLLRVQPDARMILVGEQHPDLDLDALLDRFDLAQSVRALGFTSSADFSGYMAACDVVLNLRHPTVGESSGTLSRALGLGKAVIVSDVGSFAELPHDICLKTPVDAAEEDTLFEYLNLLLARPELARELGRRARAWVVSECTWDLVARRYAEFLHAVNEGREWKPSVSKPPDVKVQPTAEDATHAPAPDDVRKWAQDDGARAYIETHLTRLDRILAITPPGADSDRILEMGAYLQITPALKGRLGYGEVRGCYYGSSGKVDHHRVTASDGGVFECDVDLFDAEKDVFPYPDGHFATVLCCELIEHLAEDPMHTMTEINRVLRPGGHLVLTTPNISSLRSIVAILAGYHPGLFPAYLRPNAGGNGEARHNREYTPREIARLMADSGFDVVRLETGAFREAPKPEHGWVMHLLDRYHLPADLRGDGIYVVGRKSGGVLKRYPAWLFDGGDG